MSRIGSIGQSVARVIRETRSSQAAAVRPASPGPGRAWPRVRGLPLVGNVLSMTGDLRSFFTEQYLQLGPVFQVQAFKRTYIVLAGPEANLFLMREGKTHLRSREPWSDFKAELGAARLLVGMDGQEHFRLRRVLRDGYSRSSIEKHIADAVAIASARNCSVATQRAYPWPAHAPAHYHRPVGARWLPIRPRVNISMT